MRRGWGGGKKEWTDCVQSDIRAFGITGIGKRWRQRLRFGLRRSRRLGGGSWSRGGKKSKTRGGGGGALPDFFFSPLFSRPRADWPPCKVVFFGLATNALNVRNNNNNFGNSSLPLGSPSFLGPRSTPGLPGMFEVAKMLYCFTMYFANAVLFISRIPLSQSRSNAQPVCTS